MDRNELYKEYVRNVENTYIPKEVSTNAVKSFFKHTMLNNSATHEQILKQRFNLTDKRLRKAISALKRIQQSKPKYAKSKEKTISQTYKQREESLQKRLHKFNCNTYHEYLKSKRWQEVKKQAKRNGLYQKCYCCHKKGRLELHHITYKHICSYEELEYSRGLIAVCRSCHQEIHDYSNRNKLSVVKSTAKIVEMYRNKLPWE